LSDNKAKHIERYSDIKLGFGSRFDGKLRFSAIFRQRDEWFGKSLE